MALLSLCQEYVSMGGNFITILDQTRVLLRLQWQRSHFHRYRRNLFDQLSKKGRKLTLYY